MGKTNSRPRKSRLLLLSLALLFLTLACNLPRTLVDRDDLLCEETGGEIIYPKDGQERHCKYPDDQENANDSLQQDEGDEETSVPTGAYVGTIIDTEWKQRDWFGSPPEVLGTVAENEVIIFIAADGTVTGSLKYIVNGTILMSDTSHGITCTVLNDRSYDGEASGKLLENTGKIIFKGEWHEVTSYSEGCNIEEHESATLQDIEIHTQVEIKNGTMYGTSVPSEGSRFHEISIILHSD